MCYYFYFTDKEEEALSLTNLPKITLGVSGRARVRILESGSRVYALKHCVC